MIELGDKAPDFTLYDAEKKERRLDELVSPGRMTILAFYPGAFTGTCTTEMCAFRDMMKELQGLNGDVVGISVDAPFAQKAFAEKNDLQFPLLCDFKREAVQKYGVVWNDLGGVKGYVAANRAIFVLDSSKTVKFKWIAPELGVLPDFDRVKAALRSS